MPRYFFTGKEQTKIVWKDNSFQLMRKRVELHLSYTLVIADEDFSQVFKDAPDVNWWQLYGAPQLH